MVRHPQRHPAGQGHVAFSGQQALQAMCTATSEVEQAVCTVTAGPARSSLKATREQRKSLSLAI